MLAAIYGSSLYKLMVLLHIFAAVVAFAPGWVWPILNAKMRKGEGVPGPVRALMPVLSASVYGPALILNGVFGALAIVLGPESGNGEKLIEFSETWVSIAFVLWFLMLGILFLALIPAERKDAHPGAVASESRVAMFGGMLHLLFLLQLINMIWQPGA